jgi:hydroxymethylpyrimidine/phosphomethylpyrimidine kinase
MQNRPAVLVIAASDSSGGAGIVRDVAVLTEHNVAVRCAITAITAQTDHHVARIEHVPPHIVHEQIRTSLSSHRIEAVKIGMLGTAQIVDAVAEALSKAAVPVVLDPVLRSSSGTRLLNSAGVERMRERLWPMTTVLTPNLLEAAELTGETQAMNEAAMFRQASLLLERGPHAVLLKGGHAQSTALDLLVTRNSMLHLPAERVAAEMRGTGCALATAIAAELATGASVPTACERAKAYVHRKLIEVAFGNGCRERTLFHEPLAG